MLRHVALTVVATCVVFLMTFPALADHGRLKPPTLEEQREAKPHILEPQHLVEDLGEPECSIHMSLAQTLHEKQLDLIEVLEDNDDNWQSPFLTGMVLALEEYYEMELSYPQTTLQLSDSGYLDERWGQLGFSIVDFSLDVDALPERSLVYVPQPLGLTAIKSTPKRGCAFTRRCFEEFSLAFLVRDASLWGIESDVSTFWMEPFCEFGLTEVAHIDKINPGASICASCT